MLNTNMDIKKFLHACHISVKNSVDSLEVQFHKISELREEQLYFLEFLEKDQGKKGKGKKFGKEYGKGPSLRGMGNSRKTFEDEKKELLDMIGLHRN